MLRIKRNDTVKVISGKDKGKKGKILHLFPGNKSVIVEGINLVKKHRRKTQQDQQGGIAEIPSPISTSNLMLVCKSCNQKTRVKFIISADRAKSRLCKKCLAPA
ncbi:MAG: 50S ribosomal protein L24 [Candidatus Omnitrophota bacterium]